MNITNLLYNNTDKIIKHIMNETDLPLNDISRGSDNDILGICDKISAFNKCLNSAQELVNYKAHRILDWLGNEKIDALSEGFDYQYDINYGFNNKIRYSYKNIINKSDIQHINNFLRINNIDQQLLAKIGSLKEGLERINHKRYIEACN